MLKILIQTLFFLPASFLEAAEVTFFNGEVCMNCSFSAGPGCVGVVHSAQLDNLILTVLSVNISGEKNCSSFDEGVYTVAVFELLQKKVLKQEPANVSNISAGISGKSLPIVQCMCCVTGYVVVMLLQTPVPPGDVSTPGILFIFTL